jgi:hypothetical protein
MLCQVFPEGIEVKNKPQRTQRHIPKKYIDNKRKKTNFVIFLCALY